MVIFQGNLQSPHFLAVFALLQGLADLPRANLQWLMIETMQEIKGVNYDIITPKCMEDFRHGTWYDVKQGALLPYPTHLF